MERTRDCPLWCFPWTSRVALTTAIVTEEEMQEDAGGPGGSDRPCLHPERRWHLCPCSQMSWASLGAQGRRRPLPGTAPSLAARDGLPTPWPWQCCGWSRVASVSPELGDRRCPGRRLSEQRQREALRNLFWQNGASPGLGWGAAEGPRGPCHSSLALAVCTRKHGVDSGQGQREASSQPETAPWAESAHRATWRVGGQAWLIHVPLGGSFMSPWVPQRPEAANWAKFLPLL